MSVFEALVRHIRRCRSQSWTWTFLTCTFDSLSLVSKNFSWKECSGVMDCFFLLLYKHVSPTHTWVEAEQLCHTVLSFYDAWQKWQFVFFFFPLLCSEYGYTALLIAPLHWLVLVLSVLLYKIPLFFVCYWTFKVLMDTNIILILLLFVKDVFANHKIVYRHHIYFIKIVWNFSEVYFSCSPDKLLMLKTKLNLVWLCVWCMMFLI